MEVFAPIDHHVAVARGHGHEADILDAGAFGKRKEVGDDGCEHALFIGNEIHLVDRDDEVRNTQQVGQRCVTARLGHDTVARVHQQNGELRSAGRSHHVARVLLVSGSVGNDELPQGGGEIAVGDVDGDALFALRDQTVGQQREVERLAALP